VTLATSGAKEHSPGVDARGWWFPKTVVLGNIRLINVGAVGPERVHDFGENGMRRGPHFQEVWTPPLSISSMVEGVPGKGNRGKALRFHSV
jgi:hypothetical protein